MHISGHSDYFAHGKTIAEPDQNNWNSVVVLDRYTMHLSLNCSSKAASPELLDGNSDI